MIRREPLIERFAEGTPALALGGSDLNALGYELHEFLCTGRAASYEPTAVFGTDGIWTVRERDEATFATRVVVVRPTDPARFNGTVVVEWLNVSGLCDAAAVWMMQHRRYLRDGCAYVAVSAQYAGVGGSASCGDRAPGIAPDEAGAPLKQLDPRRYGALDHPGDDFAYDIFSQAARSVREGRLLGPLAAKHIVGVGQSQSAFYLVTFINAVHPLEEIFDGFLVHSPFGSGAPLSHGAPFLSAGTPPPDGIPTGSTIRTDTAARVMIVAAETDVAFGFVQARQADGDSIRTWEIAGAAHGDSYILQNGWAVDDGSTDVGPLAEALAPRSEIYGQPIAKPMNAGPHHHFIVSAAGAALERWISHGTPPARAEGITLAGPADVAAGSPFSLDRHGNAVGGVRSPWTDVPVARLSGLGNQGPGFAMLVGVTEPFTPEELDRLYPGGRADYLARFGASLDVMATSGFILAADQAQALALAQAMAPIPDR